MIIQWMDSCIPKEQECNINIDSVWYFNGFVYGHTTDDKKISNVSSINVYDQDYSPFDFYKSSEKNS